MATALPAAIADPSDRLTVEQLIEQLDADNFEARENAARAAAIGKPALAALEKARGHKSLEVRWRAKAIADGMTVGVRLREFTAFAALPDDKLDLEQGMWLISRILNPDVKKQDLTRPLDELADRVRAALEKAWNQRPPIRKRLWRPCGRRCTLSRDSREMSTTTTTRTTARWSGSWRRRRGCRSCFPM